MDFFERARVVAQLARAGLAWLRHDINYPSPVPDNPKFMSARDAAALIRDGDVVAASGLGGNHRASIIYWAIREAFEETGHPAGLTVMHVGGHGGRGRAPGTLEELGRPGLCTRFVSSHFETFHAMLALAEAGECELQCVPLGTMCLLFDALGRGKTSLLSRTGVGTFIDPRSGRGSPVAGKSSTQLIHAQGARLRYELPPVDVAVFNLPAADARGNLYARGCSMLGESLELARAARRNGGRVIANVGLIVDAGYDDVILPARMVDAIVYHPDTEQTAGVFHREPWPVLTTASGADIGTALDRIRFINWLAGLVAKRTAADEVLARLAAATLLSHVPHHANVNIGTGLPEDVPRILFEAGRLGDITFNVESGVVGGLPAPGLFFGAALCPAEIISSATLFKRCRRNLDATCLGVLQVDGAGNVNVSKRGAGVRDYVGPGGFIDLAAAARTIVFVSAWMRHGQIAVEGDQLRIAKRGQAKFVEHVDEITFNGPHALRAGKQVFYATHVGLFQLTKRGMELVSVMPGIDIRRDILDATSMPIVLPASGRVARVAAPIVSGDGFARYLRRSRNSRHGRHQAFGGAD
jgi:propionate CoA-transferase